MNFVFGDKVFEIALKTFNLSNLVTIDLYGKILEHINSLISEGYSPYLDYVWVMEDDNILVGVIWFQIVIKEQEDICLVVHKLLLDFKNEKATLWLKDVINELRKFGLDIQLEYHNDTEYDFYIKELPNDIKLI